MKPSESRGKKKGTAALPRLVLIIVMLGGVMFSPGPFMRGQAHAAYCTVSGGGSDAYIMSVSVGDGSDTSGGYQGHADRTSSVFTNLVVGEGMSIGSGQIVTSTSMSVNFLIWMDLNQDGDFDDTDEEMWSTTVASSGGSPNSMFPVFMTMPSGTAGATRMRVKLERDDGTSSSCENPMTVPGEYEDYTVNIVTATSAVVLNTDDSGPGSLREAISDISAGGTITFDSGIANQTIPLSSQLTIDKNLTIDGGSNNITISGSSACRVFDVTAGTVTFKNLTIANANAGAEIGGGILAATSTNVTVSGCTIRDSTAAKGGAICFKGTLLTVEDSTLSGNGTSATHGGALDIDGDGDIRNTTIYGNNASTGGGAVNANPGNTVTFKNCTIAGNNTGIRGHDATFNLQNTILSNTGSDCYFYSSLTIGTNTNNLIKDGSCSDSATGMLTGDPMLGPLQNNGGSTDTMALLEGSPAINAGDSGTSLSLDQRGYSKNDGSPDIGAFEYHGGYPMVTTATPSMVSTTEFSGRGNITSVGDGNATARGICWDVNPAPDTSDSKEEEAGDFGTGNFTATLTPLISGKTYYARAYATNLRGTAYGDEVSFTTPMTPPGNALSFDGSDDSVRIPFSSELDVYQQFTIEFWTKPQDLSYRQGIIGNRHSDAGADGLSLECNIDNGALNCSDINACALSYTLPDVDVWYHAAFTYDGTTFKFFINGNEVASDTGSASSASNPWRIGNYWNGSGPFDGSLDDIRIWNVPRSEGQIQANMHSQLDGTEGNLVAYYNFNQISGTTLTDISGNGNHGTVSGGETWAASGAFTPFGKLPINVSDSGFTARWNAVAGATGYRIDVADNTAFNVPVISDEAAGAGTSYTVSTRVSSGTPLYYRIRAEMGAWTTPDSGTVPVMLPPGNALSFDGTDDYVSTPLSSGLNTTNPFTFEAWIKTAADGNIMGKADNEWGGTQDYDMNIGISGKLRFGQWNVYAAAEGTSTADDIDIDDNVWHHIAVVHAGGTVDNVKLYVDGKLAQTKSGKALANNPNLPVVIGGYVMPGLEFAGLIDEVRVWDTVRSEADIQANMHKELTGSETGLIAYYNFNHVSGTTLADLTGTGNDGTLVNGPAYGASGAIVGNIGTAHLNDIRAIWGMATDASATTGLSLDNASVSDHIVFGNNNASGTTGDDTPADEAAGFQRLSRTWQTDVVGTASSDMTFDLSDAGASALTGPDEHGLVRYVLLRRTGDSGAFEIVKTADSLTDDQIVFESVSLGDSYYTLGLRADSAPTVANAVGGITVSEDAGPTTRNLGSVFTDIDNDDTAIAKSVASNSDPSLVAASIVGNTLTLTFGSDRNGMATVVIRGTSNGKTSDDTVTVTVSPMDDPPYLASALRDVTADEDAADTVISLAGLFKDIDSPLIAKTVFSNSDPSLVSANVTDDTLTLGYLENRHGTVEITIRGTADGRTIDDTFTVTVSPIDDAPSVAREIADVTADEDSAPITMSLADVFTDVDDDDAEIAKTLVANDNPSLVAATIVGDMLTLEFQADQHGTATIIVQGESDGQTAEDAFTVMVNPVDDPLTVVSGIPDVTADEDAAPVTISLDSVFADIDSGISAITKTVLSNDTPSLVAATIAGDTLTLEFQENQHGTAMIIVQGESDGQTAEDAFTVTVNPVDDLPVVANRLPDLTADEDAADTVVDLVGVFADIDNDEDSMVMSVMSVSTPSLIAATISGDTLTLEHQENQNGTATVVIIAESGGETVTDEFVVTVTPVDDPPEISAIGDQTTDRNHSADPVGFMVSDPDGDELTVSAASSDTGLVPDGNIVLIGSEEERIMTITPAADAHGIATITLTVTDGILTAETSFVLTVRHVYEISGQVAYYSNGVPVPDVLVTIDAEDGSFSAEALTDEEGKYVLSGIPPGGHYVSVPSKSGDPGPGSLSVTDASRIARFVTRSVELDKGQAIAADVTGNGEVSGLDASRVATYCTGLREQMNDSGVNWTFSPASVSLNADSDMEDQDFAAMRVGDVSGNFMAEARKRTSARPVETSDIPEVFAAPGSVLSVPVILSHETETEGIDIVVGFDGEVLKAEGADLGDGIPEDGYELVVGTRAHGQMSAGIFATDEVLACGGTVAVLRFGVTGQSRDQTTLTFSRFDRNEIPVTDADDAYRSDSSASGGFYVNDTVTQRLSVIVGSGENAEYDLIAYDVNGDGRIGSEDVILLLREGDVQGAIRALHVLAQR